METLAWMFFVAVLVLGGLLAARKSVRLGLSLVAVGIALTLFILFAPDSFRGESVDAVS